MRKLRNKSKPIMIIVLIAFITVGILPIGDAQADKVLGTNLALGSPLLNNSFNNEDWDQWEIVAFGMFLSNFAYPLIDDYQTAFTNSTSGSKGSGFKALDFGTGSDPANHEVLKKLLDYIISIQTDTANLREILVRWEDRTDNSVGEGEGGSYAYATINDFLSEDFGRRSKSLPIFMIKTGPADDDSGKEVVFSFKDGWDVQMLAAWMSRVTLGDFRKEANSALDKMIENDEQIYLDAIGNIVAMNEGRPVVIFPAASNQHLTSDGRYNLVTSVMLGGNYSTSSKSNLVDYLETETRTLFSIEFGHFTNRRGAAVDSPSSKKFIKPGSAVLIFDSAVAETSSDNLIGDTLVDILLENGVDDLAKVLKDDTVADLTQVLLTNKVEGLAQVLMGNKGDAVAKVLMADINDKQTPMGFTVGVVGLDDVSGVHDRFKDLYKVCSMISTAYPTSNNRDKLTYIKMNNGKQLSLFSNAATTSVSIRPGDDAWGGYSSKLFRRYLNYIQDYLDTGKTIVSEQGEAIIPNRNTVIESISKQKEALSLTNILLFGGDLNVKMNPLLASFIETDAASKSSNSLFTKSGKASKSIYDCHISNIEPAGYKYNNNRLLIDFNSWDAAKLANAMGRIVKVYPYNETLSMASGVFGLRSGMDFGKLSPYIYLTYLDFYGVTSGSNKFNSSIYDAESDLLKVDITKMTAGAMMSEEEKKAKLLDYSFMLLDPEQGKQYRSDMAMSNFSDWIYRTYQRIVHGKATEYNDSNANLSSRYSAGFLKVDNYSENFMTKWLLDKYAKYILIFIGLGVLLIIIYGIMSRRKFIWFLMTIIALVVILILTPAFGEITPYITNNYVQGMFKDKMSYWTISESVANAQIEKASSQRLENLNSVGSTNDNEISLEGLVKALNVVHLDRSLTVKNDISKKVNENFEDYEKIQSLQSARWLLPIMMRQFTADDKSAEYVYVPLADVYDNLSNLYWIYKPSDAIGVQTQAARDITGNFGEGDIDNGIDLATKTAFYEDYIDTSNSSNVGRGMYSSLKISSDNEDFSTGSPGWESLSRMKDDSDVVHAGAYILKDLRIPSVQGAYSYSGEESKDKKESSLRYDSRELWDNYLEMNKSNTALKVSFNSMSSKIEQTAGTYDKYNPSTSMDSCFGYLWYTESPFHYFYDVIKDTFDSGITVGAVTGELQGAYGDNRQTIMHYRDTGKVRDFLDMQELFTNVVPYLYKTQILAGGRDGKDGLLQSSEIETYSLYEGMNKSWLFRSNWATKLMTSEVLSKEARVTDAEGNVHVVKDPMDPSTYPEQRPMVFSEAQMYATGLNELDLNSTELRILKVNKDVMEKWSLILNYINIKGITTEVLYRHMATDATIAFNTEFSPVNKVNSKYALYPNGVDLRSISFDSVMKMLMLNTTRDSDLIYGDTMQKIISDSDIFSAIVLLFAAFLSAMLTPFVRNVLLGILLFLGFWALLTNILRGPEAKLKITTAYIINHALFLLMTIGYFLVFAVILNSSYRDDVLNVSNVSVTVGTPVWIFFIIVIANILYIWGAWRIMKVVVKNRHDLGFEVYGTLAYGMANVISSGLNKLTGGKVGKTSYSNRSTQYNYREGDMGDIYTEKLYVDERHSDRDDDDNYYDPYGWDYEWTSEEEMNKNYSQEVAERAERIEEKVRRGAQME